MQNIFHETLVFFSSFDLNIPYPCFELDHVKD